MRTPGKWITALSASDAPADAARAALQDRLNPLPRLLQRAASARDRSPNSPRRIHQLRVATRRASAAITAFQDVLPPRKARRMKRLLRRIRRIAGIIRDGDLAGARLLEDARVGPKTWASASATLADLAATERAQAFAQLRKLAGRLLPDRFDRRARALIASVDPAAVAETAVVPFARRVLHRDLDDLRAAAQADLSVVEHVHDLRLAIKSLRYGAEVFGACFDGAFRRAVLPELAALQDRLGEFNDLAALAGRARLAAEKSEGSDRAVAARLARLAGRYDRRLAHAHAEFLTFWRGFDFASLCNRFEQALRPSLPAHPRIEIKPLPRLAIAGRPPGADSAAPRRRLAAIDVGTNSLRLIIAEAAPDGSYRVLDDEKEVTRLGRGMYSTGRLSDESIEHSVAAIDRMKSIAEGYGASDIRIVATAAAREAANAADLTRAVLDRTGLEMEIISAEQEAMLAFRSAARAFDLRSVSAAVVDVGGGSTEVVLSVPHGSPGAFGAAGAAPDPLVDRIYSIPIGAVRITEQFGGPERCAGKRFGDMKRFVRRVVAQHIRSVPAAPQVVIGTGGTLTSLGAMAIQRGLGADWPGQRDDRADGLRPRSRRHAETSRPAEAIRPRPRAGGPPPHGAHSTGPDHPAGPRGFVSEPSLFGGVVQGHDVPRSELRHLLAFLRELTPRQRSRVPGLSADRADIILAGLVIIDAVLKRLGVNRVRIHDGGIRDGLLLSMVHEPLSSAQAGHADPLAAVRRFARSCAYEEPHSLHVARLSLQLFDQLTGPIGAAISPHAFDPARARLLLEAAAVLHDVGYIVNYTAHHKHSFHLIVHADLPGWTSREIQVIANIARYHRCAEPKKKHAAFAMLDPADRQLVRVLGGILRVADGLDRTHMQRIRQVEVRTEHGAAHISASSESEPGVDLWGAARKAGLFERTLGLVPHFEWRRDLRLTSPAPSEDRVGLSRAG